MFQDEDDDDEEEDDDEEDDSVDPVNFFGTDFFYGVPVFLVFVRYFTLLR